MNGLNVSRETQERLEIYAALLQKWSPKINLVASGSLPNLWERHFLDSAQVLERIDAVDGTWFDLGSGGGFPGLVCA
ncbi:MAG: 16S rRNA (guanine527-N7)-methyltransferase, partial [Paracoccaceae bacterium]